MKRNILCTLAVMAACAILVACGKTDDQISPITPESNAASSEAEATPEPPPTPPPRPPTGASPPRHTRFYCVSWARICV